MKLAREGSAGMPANVESMFSVRQMPWHREGTILEEYPGDWDTARTLAGLGWDPVTSDVYAVGGYNRDLSLRYEPITGWKAITRSDTRAVLSINKDSYTVIDHAEMGEIVEAVLAQPNVKWETAGSPVADHAAPAASSVEYAAARRYPAPLRPNE
jgi:hypothetical protein